MSALWYACTDNTTIGDDNLLGDIENVEVEYSFDNVTYNYSDLVTNETDQVAGVGHYAEFTSVVGESDQVSEEFVCDFEGREVLGKEMWGRMSVTFKDASRTVNIKIGQTRLTPSFIVDAVRQEFNIEANGINFHDSYTDSNTGKEISEYMVSGSDACDRTVNLKFKEVTNHHINELFMMGCANNAYIKVTAYHK